MSALTEQQKARIVELAQKAERNFGFAFECGVIQYRADWHRDIASDASAEAFRIAQEARS